MAAANPRKQVPTPEQYYRCSSVLLLCHRALLPHPQEQPALNSWSKAKQCRRRPLQRQRQRLLSRPRAVLRRASRPERRLAWLWRLRWRRQRRLRRHQRRRRRQNRCTAERPCASMVLFRTQPRQPTIKHGLHRTPRGLRQGPSRSLSSPVRIRRASAAWWGSSAPSRLRQPRPLRRFLQRRIPPSRWMTYRQPPWLQSAQRPRTRQMRESR